MEDNRLRFVCLLQAPNTPLIVYLYTLAPKLDLHLVRHRPAIRELECRQLRARRRHCPQPLVRHLPAKRGVVSEPDMHGHLLEAAVGTVGAEGSHKLAFEGKEAEALAVITKSLEAEGEDAVIEARAAIEEEGEAAGEVVGATMTETKSTTRTTIGPKLTS